IRFSPNFDFRIVHSPYTISILLPKSCRNQSSPTSWSVLEILSRTFLSRAQTRHSLKSLSTTKDPTKTLPPKELTSLSSSSPPCQESHETNRHHPSVPRPSHRPPAAPRPARGRLPWLASLHRHHRHHPPLLRQNS